MIMYPNTILDVLILDTFLCVHHLSTCGRIEEGCRNKGKVFVITFPELNLIVSRRLSKKDNH